MRRNLEKFGCKGREKNSYIHPKIHTVDKIFEKKDCN